METIAVLVTYRPRNPNCASFDQYIIVPVGYSPADIYNTAVDNIYDLLSTHYQPPRQGFDICDPLGYDIDVGPTLAELA